MTLIKFSEWFIPIWKWDQQKLYVHVSLACMNATVSFVFQPRKDIHGLLLRSPLSAVACLTVAPRVCFTRLSTTASKMKKGRVNWSLLASFEKTIQLKRKYP